MFRQQSQDRQRVQVRAPAPGDDQRPYVLFVCVEGAELVIGMGCDVAAACPALTTPLEDWDLDDPKGRSVDEVSDIRDFIELRVRNLIGKLGRDA